MADFNYSAKIKVDPNEIRKSVEAGLDKVAFSLSGKSHAAAIADIQNHVIPRLSFTTSKNSLRVLRRELTDNLGAVPIRFTVDKTSFAQQIRHLAREKIAIDVSINDSRNAFRNLGKVTGQIADKFDDISKAKDRFAANVDEKFPKIIDRVRSLNEELNKVKANFSEIRIPKVRDNSERRQRAEVQKAAIAGVTTTGNGKSADPVRQTTSLANSKTSLASNTRKANEELARYNTIVEQSTRNTNTFAERVGFTTGRLSAYLLPATSIFQLTSGLGIARDQIVEINRSITQLTQIMKGDADAASRVSDQVFDISQRLGQSAIEVLNVTKFLAQAGETFTNETGLVRAVEALAATNLGATFGNIEETAQGALAYINQFNKSADDMVHVLDVANTLSRDFAVEAGDLFEAVRTGGAAFATFGGSIEEFQSVVTTLRQLTRLPTATIGAGLNTIVLSVFSPENLSFIRQLGIEVDDSQGRMRSFVDILTDVGAQFRTLSQEQKGVVAVQLFDVRQSKIGIRLLEDLGRTGEKVGDKQASVFRQAMDASTDSAGSLFRDANLGLNRIDAQMQSVGAAFQEAFGQIAQDESFLQFIREAATGLKVVAEALQFIAPIIPSLMRTLTASALVSTVRASSRFAKGFRNAAQGGQLMTDGVDPGSVGSITPGRNGHDPQRMALQRAADDANRAQRDNTIATQTLTESTEQLINTIRNPKAAAINPSSPAGGQRTNRDVLQERLNRQQRQLQILDSTLNLEGQGKNGRPRSNREQYRTYLERPQLEARRETLRRSIEETKKEIKRVIPTPLPTGNKVTSNLEKLHDRRGNIIIQSRAVGQSLSNLDKDLNNFKKDISNRALKSSTYFENKPYSLPNLRKNMDVGRLALAHSLGIDKDPDKLAEFALPHERKRALTDARQRRREELGRVRDLSLRAETGNITSAENTRLTNAGGGELVSTRARSLHDKRRAAREQQRINFIEEQAVSKSIAQQERERLNRYADEGLLGPVPADKAKGRGSLRDRAKNATGGLGRTIKTAGMRGGSLALDISPYILSTAFDALASASYKNTPIGERDSNDMLSRDTRTNVLQNRNNAALRGSLTGAATGFAAGATLGAPGMIMGALVGSLMSGLLSYKTAVDETRSSLMAAASASKTLAGTMQGIVLVAQDFGNGASFGKALTGNDPAAAALQERLRSLTGTMATTMARNNRNLTPSEVSRRFSASLMASITEQVRSERKDLDPAQQGEEVQKIFNNVFAFVIDRGQQAYKAATNQEALNQSLVEFSSTLQVVIARVQQARENAQAAIAANNAVGSRRSDVLSAIQGRGGQAPNVGEDFADIVASRFRTSVDRGTLTGENADAMTLGFLNRSERRDATLVSQLSRITDDLFKGFVTDVNREDNVPAAASVLSGKFLSRINSAFIPSNFGVSSFDEMSGTQKELVGRFETLLKRQASTTGVATFQNQDPRKLREGLFSEAGDLLTPVVDTLRARLILLSQSIEQTQQVYDVQRQVVEQYTEAASRATSNSFARIGRLRNIGVDDSALSGSVKKARAGIGSFDIPGATAELGVSKQAYIAATRPIVDILKASGQNANPNQLQESVQTALRNGLVNLNSKQAQTLYDITGTQEARGLSQVLTAQEDRKAGRETVLDPELLAVLKAASPSLKGIFSANKTPTGPELDKGLSEAATELGMLAQSSAQFMTIQTNASAAYNNLMRSQDNYDRQIKNSERTLQALNEEFSNAQNILNKNLQTNSQLGKVGVGDIAGAQIGLAQARGFGVFNKLGGIQDLPDIASAPRDQVIGAARAFAGIPDAIAQRITQSLNLAGNRKVEGNLTGTNAAEIFEQLRGAGRLGDVGQNVDEVRNGFGQLFDINNQMASIEDMQVNALFDIARNTSLMAERMLNLNPGELMRGSIDALTQSPNRGATQGPPETIRMSRYDAAASNTQEVGRLNSQLAALPALVTALETASRASGANIEQFTRGLQQYMDELRTSGGRASNVQVDANLSVTGFENVGKDVAIRSIISSLMQNFASQLGDTPGEMQLRDKLNLALRQIHTGPQNGK